MSAATIEQLDADGLAEYLAQDFALEPQGQKLEFAGDAVKFECDDHTRYCTGCSFCWIESYERGTDI